MLSSSGIIRDVVDGENSGIGIQSAELDVPLNMFNPVDLESTISMIDSTAMGRSGREAAYASESRSVDSRVRKRSNSDPLGGNRSTDWWEILNDIEELDSPLPLNCYGPGTENTFIPLGNSLQSSPSRESDVARAEATAGAATVLDNFMSGSVEGGDTRKRKIASTTLSFNDHQSMYIPSNADCDSESQGLYASTSSDLSSLAGRVNADDAGMGVGVGVGGSKVSDNSKELPVGPSVSLRWRESAISAVRGQRHSKRHVDRVPVVPTRGVRNKNRVFDDMTMGLIANELMPALNMPRTHGVKNSTGLPFDALYDQRMVSQHGMFRGGSSLFGMAGTHAMDPIPQSVDSGKRRKQKKKNKRKKTRRGGYTCAKCGEPKKGHLCPFRRQWTESGTQIDYSVTTPRVIVVSSSSRLSKKSKPSGKKAPTTDKEVIRKSMSAMHLV